MTHFYHVPQQVQHLDGLQNMEDRRMLNGEKKQNNEPPKGTSNEQVRKLMDLGYEGIIPIPFGTKNPGRRGWQNAPLTPDDADERVPAGQKWNLGLLNDKTNAVDVDIPDPELAASVADLEPEAWTRAPLRIGEWPKSARWFKPGNASGTKRARFKPEADSDRKLRDGRPAPKKVEIEIRTGPGMQTVALGRHPSGCDYRYEGPSVLDVPFSELPSLMQADVDAYLRRAESAFEAAGYVNAKEGDAVRAMYPEDNQKEPKVAPVNERETEGPIPLYNYRSTVISVLLDGPNRLDREHWISFAHCLQTMFGKDDREMREAWIEFSGLYDGEQKEGEAERVWDTTAELHGVHTRESFWKLLDEAGLGTSRVKMHGVQDDGHDPRPLSMKIRLGEASEDDRPPWDDGTDEDDPFSNACDDADELEEDYAQGAEFVIPQWLPKRTVTTLFGKDGVGKTMLAQRVATALAAGKPILGRPAGMPVKTMLALCEDEMSVISDRQRKLRDDLGITKGELKGNLIIPRDLTDADVKMIKFDRDFTMTETAFAEKLVKAMERYGPEFLVLDPINDLFADEENSRPKVSQFMRWLNRMAKRFDCALLLIGHPAKAEDSEYSGSGAWSSKSRSRWLLDAKNDRAGSPLILKHRKSSYGPRQGDVIWIWSKNGVPRPLSAQQAVEHDTAALGEIGALIFDFIRRGAANGKGYSATKQSGEAWLPKAMVASGAARGASEKELMNAITRLLAPDGPLTKDAKFDGSNGKPDVRYGGTNSHKTKSGIWFTEAQAVAIPDW